MYLQVRRGLFSVVCVLSLALGCGETGDAGASDDMDDGASEGDALGGLIDSSDDGANASGPQYLVYGVVYGAATVDCPEGGDYRDSKRWYAKVVTGSPAETSDAEADALRQQMMRELPRQRTYSVESSSQVAGDRVSHLVVIQYAQIVAGRFCRPQVLTRGYGTSYNSALAQAILSKEVNGGKNVSHIEVGHVTWTPQAP